MGGGRGTRRGRGGCARMAADGDGMLRTMVY